MAQLKQCPNGHYFDPSMYPSCPYCSDVTGKIDRSVSDYGIKTSIPTGSIGTVYPGGVPETGDTPAGGNPTVSPGGSIGTMDVVNPDERKHDTVPPYKIEDTKPTVPVRPKPEVYPQPKEPDPVPQNKDEEELPVNSVVGWLVAVGGPYIGRSFELHHEYNYIGRETGDIILAKDAQVSRIKNAWVMYSGRNNRFKFGAGESSNIVYVNNDELAANSSVVLKPYDQIEIGASKFRFIPFCSEQFKW